MGDIVNGKVIISADLLILPFFKKIWESEKDKSRANDIISYIVLKNKYNSPYVTSMTEEERDAKLRAKYFEEGWTPSEDILLAEKEYIELTDTLNLKLLRSFRKKLEAISKFLDTPTEYMDMKMVKDILASAAMIDKTIRSIDELEEQVKIEELKKKSIRGKAKVNRFEVPNR